MEARRITEERMASFRQYLLGEERSGATVEKYLREVGQFSAWLAGEAVSKTAAAQW